MRRIEAAGFVLLATFSDPQFTVVLPTIQAVDELALVFGELVANRYAEKQIEER